MEPGIQTHSSDKFQHDGFLYVFNNSNASQGVHYWRCEYFNNKNIKCVGRLHTDESGNVLKQIGEHTCQGAVNLDLNLDPVNVVEVVATPASINPTTHRIMKIETPNGQPSEMEVSLSFRSRQGRGKFHHDGFVYIFHKSSAKQDIEYWRCVFSNTKNIKCQGRLHVDLAGNVLKQVGEHKCPSRAVNLDTVNVVDVETKPIITKMRKRRSLKQENPSELSNLALADDEEELFGKRVALFLRRLPPKKKRIVSIEIEHLMLSHEPDDPPE